MATKKKSVGKKIAIAVAILFAALLIYGLIQVVMLIVWISGSFSRDPTNNFLLAGKNVNAFLDENGFAYDKDSKIDEKGILKEMTFVIRDRDATATLQLGYDSCYVVKFELDDPYKDSEGKLYSLLPLVGSLTGQYNYVNLDEIQTEAYLYRDTEEETIYRRYVTDLLSSEILPQDSKFNYGFTYTLRSDGDSYSIYDSLSERYRYETVKPAE